MKECKYCGTKYKDELDVCPNCGGNLIVTAEEIAQAAELAQKEKENQQRSVVEPQNHLKKLIGIIAGVIAAIIVIVVVASYAHNHRAVNGDLSRADMAEAYEQGMTYYNSKDYALAIAELGKVSAESKYYDEASAILQEAVAIYSDDALSKASAYANAGDYKMACTILENALQVVPANSALTAELASYQETFRNQLRSSTLEAVESSIAENDYPTAVQTLSSTLDVLNSDIELNALFEKYRSEYRDMIITQADEALESDGYEAAIGVVNQGLVILDNDTVLLQAIDKYKEYEPIYLIKLDYFSGTEDKYLNFVDSEQDNMGNTHYNCFTSSVHRTYVLDGQYRRLTAVLYQSYAGRSQEAYSMGDAIHLKILGDGEVLYSNYIERGATGIDPIALDIPLDGVSKLEIDFSGYSYGWGPFLSLGDVYLHP